MLMLLLLGAKSVRRHALPSCASAGDNINHIIYHMYMYQHRLNGHSRNQEHSLKRKEGLVLRTSRGN
jgi:hypothetical protein